MESLNTIINNLTNVANTMGYSGPTVDAIIYLAANSIYNNEINAITASLEASPSRCKLLNSAIQHAKDVGMSVNRGRNQRIKISGIRATTNNLYHKYDQAAKIGNYYLYYANDYSVTSNNVYNLEFIVGKNIISENIEVKSNSDLLRLKSEKTNYSSDIMFQDSNDNVLAFTEVKRDIFDIGSSIKYWMTTSTDFGVEIYIFPSNLETVKVDKFSAEEIYKLKGVEYLEDTIDTSSIRTIPGFRIEDNTTIISENREDRSTDITKIYKDSMKFMDSGFIIRAGDDIETSIMAINNNIKACNIIVTPPTFIDIENSEELEYDPGHLYVYYLTEDLKDTYGLTEVEKNAIISKLKKSYYVSQEFSFNLAKPHIIKDDSGNKRNYKLYLKVFYDSEIDYGAIDSYVNSFNYSIGTKFDPNKIIGGLVSEFKGIRYVRFQTLKYGDVKDIKNESDTDEIELAENEFINFDLKILYESLT